MLLPLLLWLLWDTGGAQRNRFPPTNRFQPPQRPNNHEIEGLNIPPRLLNQALQMQPNHQQQQGFAPQRLTSLTIPQGALRGKFVSTPSGKGLVAFLGIPYATAPVGPLRFKAPVSHPGWSSVLDASSFRSACPQFDYRGRIVGNEDCLFVNVFTPGVRPGQNRVGYPVMVFVHGGNFESGASSVYGPSRLVDKDIVVVTFNYRIGILGFLSTGDAACPGNMGLLDQNMALRWVRDNIGHFGGDPNMVTLFGQGAGAVSVWLHILSPQSQGLFERAIAESGTPLSDWALETKPQEFSKVVATGAGCSSTESTYATMDCLMQTPASELLRMQQESKTFGDFPVRTAPVMDSFQGQGAFLPEDPLAILDRGDFRKVPLMAGVNRDEASFFYPALAAYLRDRSGREPGFVRTMLLPKFFNSAMRYQDPPAEVLDSVDNHYFRGINPMDSNAIIGAFVNMSTDAMFVSGNHATLSRYSRYEAPTYMYLFEYRGDSSLLDARLGFQRQPFDLGVSNGDELVYLFDVMADGLRPLSNLDSLVSSRVVNLWTDFAKSGEAPQYTNFEYPQWPRVTPTNVSTYRIGRALRPGPEYREGAVQLWAGISPTLNGRRHGAGTAEPLTTLHGGYVEPLYRTLAWAMVAVAIALAICVVVLVAVLYNQKKSQSFRASSDLDNSRMSGSSTLY